MQRRRLLGALLRRQGRALCVVVALVGAGCGSGDATGPASADATGRPSSVPSASSPVPAWAAPSGSAGAPPPLLIRFEERSVRIAGGEAIPFVIEDRPMRIDPLFEQLKALRASAPRIAIDGDRATRGVVVASVLGTVRFAGRSDRSEVRLRTPRGAVDVALVGAGTCPPPGLHEGLVLKAHRSPEGTTMAWVNGWGSEVGFPFVPLACRPFDRECVRRLVPLPPGADQVERARHLEAMVAGHPAAAVILGTSGFATFGAMTDELDAWSAAGAKALVIDHEMREAPSREDAADCKIQDDSRK